jgi:site-specific DNA-methyltransferase (adenine-specific)
MVELLNIDCLLYMATCKDKQFDLAIVDPPYGINAPNMQMGSAPNRKDGSGYPSVSTTTKLKSFHRRGKLKDRALNRMNTQWDLTPPGEEYFKELKRISKDQIIWGGNYFPLPPTRGIICWDKLQPWDNFSQFEIAWTSFNCPAAMFKYSNTGGANAEKKIHPTQKPVALYKWILSKYGKPGYKIFDSHLGSGSSAIAAHDFGCDFVGTEIDLEYYTAAVKRFENHKLQQTIKF